MLLHYQHSINPPTPQTQPHAFHPNLNPNPFHPNFPCCRSTATGCLTGRGRGRWCSRCSTCRGTLRTTAARWAVGGGERDKCRVVLLSGTGLVTT